MQFCYYHVDLRVNARIFSTEGHIDLSITSIQLPPMLAWTPYQILGEYEPRLDHCTITYQAIAPRLNVHHRLPYRPKLVLATTGNVTWKTAPIGSDVRTSRPGNEVLAWSSIQYNKWRRAAVSKPNTDPSLPPRQADSCLYHRRNNHPTGHALWAIFFSTQRNKTYVLTLKLSAIQLNSAYLVNNEWQNKWIDGLTMQWSCELSKFFAQAPRVWDLHSRALLQEASQSWL